MTVNQSADYLQKYLDYEESADLLKFKFDGTDILIWPYIRSYIITLAIMQDKGVDIEKVDNGFNAPKVTRFRAVRYLFSAIFHRPHTSKSDEILILTSDSLIQGDKEGKKFNWLHDPYAAIFPQKTLIMEKNEGYKYLEPKYYTNTRSIGLILIKARIKAHLFLKKKDINVCNLLSYIRKDAVFAFPETIFTSLEKRLNFYGGKEKIERLYWERFFDKSVIKILFVHCAANGGSGHILKAAHERGIVCCEFQHAILTRNMVPYTYTKRLIHNKEYQNYLPDYFLTFGEFWNDFPKWSAKPVTIGNPKAQMIKKYLSAARDNKKKILIVFNDFGAECATEFLSELLKKYDKSHFVLRPHPHDFLSADYIREYAKEHEVKLDKKRNILELLSEACLVLMFCRSTVTFEAMFFRVPCYIYSRYSVEEEKDYYSGEFNTLQDVDSIIQSGFKERSAIKDPEKFFGSDWESKYAEFVKATVGISR